MEKIAFKMHLTPGMADTYRQRHDDIWPELTELLRQSGITDYSIFLDEDTHTLFAVLKRTDDNTMAALPKQAVMQRWWTHMADIMRTEPNGEPQVTALPMIFHMD